MVFIKGNKGYWLGKKRPNLIGMPHLFKRGHIPWNKRGRFIKCEICQKEIWIEPKQENKKKYCSQRCYTLSQKCGMVANNGVFKKGHRNFLTNKSKQKISQTLKGKLKSGKHKKNIGKAKKGNKNPNWKGGTTPRFLSGRCIAKYKRWRERIFKRDNFICQGCKNIGGEINAHHIKSWVEYPKLRYNLLNGITLCKKCHWKVHREGSEYIK